ncbi:hypothetical protein ES703_103054 [subsurface metagenome]
MPIGLMDRLRKNITLTRRDLEKYPYDIIDVRLAFDDLEEAVNTEIQRLLWLRHIKEDC